MGTVVSPASTVADRPRAERTAPTFVDLFAGAGGLSLGLSNAGLQGLFAIEHESNAFETLKWNLIERRPAFDWPGWLPQEPHEISHFTRTYKDQLRALRGQVTLLAGGPPCQGFSAAGRRRRSDPRNRLFQRYIEVAELIQPPLVMFENVPGFAVEFNKTLRHKTNPRRLGRPPKAFSTRLSEELGSLGYQVLTLRERAADFGVPQTRPRYLILGIHRDLGVRLDEAGLASRLAVARKELLDSRDLPLDRSMTVREAISDLETEGHGLVECDDSPRFQQVEYTGPRTHYQRLMHGGMGPIEAPNSMRLARHRAETLRRLRKILATCRKGVKLSDDDRARLGLSKISVTPLDGDRPANTLTSLPDDFVHYSEPRILTVREYARIQSFPDWYEFRGKYTTGGMSRRFEVPRYTQVANAVPPLLAEAVGRMLLRLCDEVAVLAESAAEADAAIAV